MMLNSFPGVAKTLFSGGNSSYATAPNGTPQGQEVFNQDPVDQINQALSHPSIAYRCVDLPNVMARTSTEDLRKCFPVIVNSIFGFGPHVGWGLRTLTRRDTPREMDATQKFLGPEGPIIQLSYRLMMYDPLLRYDFPLQALPISIQRNITHNDIPAYFPKNIRFKYAPPNTPYALQLNPFEYYIYVFASLLVGNRAEQGSYLFGWNGYQNLTETVYTTLLEDFLQYFLPTHGRAVAKIPQEESPPLAGLQYATHLTRNRIPTRFSLPLSSAGPKVPKLFRPSILDDESYVIASRNISISQEYSPMERENWRSETVVSAFIIMWMHIDCSEGTLSSQFETILPNIEMVKSVRMIVRHFHFFNNTINATVLHPLEEIKKFLFPLFQRRLYVFLRYLFKHWPMDHSFRIVYETWLSYIQPWRYTSQDGGVVRDREEMQIDQRWNEFISDNVLFYTYLLQDMFVRIAKSDLTTYRNAHMLFRTTKILTSQKIIKPTLKNLDSSLAQLNRPPPISNISTPSALKKRGNAKINLNTSAFSPRRVSFNDNSFTAANSSSDSYVGQIAPSPYAVSSSRFERLGSTFKDLEDSKIGYTPLFSSTYRDLARAIIKNMDKSRDFCVHYISDRNAIATRPVSTLSRLTSFFYRTEDHFGGSTASGAAEKEKVIQFIDSSKGALAGFFDIVIPGTTNGTIGADRSRPLNPLNGFHDSDSAFGMSSPAFLSPREMPIALYQGYKGHPDHAPFRWDENAKAIHMLNSVAKLLNALFGAFIRDNYMMENSTGKLLRAAVAKPEYYEELRKRGPGDSFRIKKCLAPRIVLRPLGSTVAIFNLFGFIVFGILIGLDGYGWFLLPLIIYTIYILIRAYFEPVDNLYNLRQEFGGQF